MLSEKQKQDIISFTAELVGYSCESGDEQDVAECVRQKMRNLGYDEVIVDEFGSVLGILNGKTPGQTLLFDGHLDVVPIREIDKWEHEPFGGEISDGRLWGRGTTDMKGALAAMVCAPSYLDRSELNGKIIVSASVAEERLIGTALNLVLDRFPVDAVVIGEPTGLKLGIAEKGRASIEVICHGMVAHSSRPDLGDNAVYRMMTAVERIRNMSRRRHPLLGDEVIELVEISSSPTPGNGSIPGECRALWECRLLMGETREGFLERWMQALDGLERTEIRIADYELMSYTGKPIRMDDYLPGWETEDAESGFTGLAGDAVRECGRALEYYAAPYGCNALASAALKKIPTVIIGPGDIALAHKPNENVIIDDLLTAAEIYGRICRKIPPVKGDSPS